MGIRQRAADPADRCGWHRGPARERGADRGGMIHCSVELEHSRACADAVKLPGSSIRHEHRRLFQPAQFTAGLRVKMHGRREAARAQDQVAVEVRSPWLGLRRCDAAAAHRVTAGNPRNHGIAEPLSAALKRFCADHSVRPAVGDGQHLDAESAQRCGDPVSLITVGRDHDAAAACDAIGMGVFLNRAGQHDAGTVVVGKYHGPLERAGGGNHRASPDLPQAFAQRARRIG